MKKNKQNFRFIQILKIGGIKREPNSKECHVNFYLILLSFSYFLFRFAGCAVMPSLECICRVFCRNVFFFFSCFYFAICVFGCRLSWSRCISAPRACVLFASFHFNSELLVRMCNSIKTLRRKILCIHKHWETVVVIRHMSRLQRERVCVSLLYYYASSKVFGFNMWMQ